MSSEHIPAYTRHRASGQAVVRLDGRDFYLGVWRSPRSKAEYNRLIAEWLAAGRKLPVDPGAVTIIEIVNAFRKYAQSYYGAESKSATNVFYALKPLLKLYGRTPASEFGPLRLKVVRDAMIAEGWVRSNINRHVVRIRGVFKWAAENELISSSIYHGLMSLAGLRAGRSGAAESQATNVRKQFGVEGAQAILGHRSIAATQIYAEKNREAAMHIAAEVG